MSILPHRILGILVLLLTICIVPVSDFAWAEELLYAGKPNQGLQTIGQASQTQPGTSAVVPVTYNTNYDTQFSPYASFMESPGPLQQQYVSTSATAGGPGNADPYAASEISPFSHYSPYMEVVGQGSKYTLGIDDVITIIVRNQPDFSGRYVVDPEGKIQYNFVGDIPAEGKTKDELKVDIVEALKRFVRYPEVAVMISEYNSKAVYVFGYVNSPGKYAMKGDHISVKEAIVAAGLPAEDGSMKRVYVVRPSEFTEDGKATSKKVDLKDLIIKGDSAEDFMLEPGDTIVVHQKYLDKFLNTISRLLEPVYQAEAIYELRFER